MTAQLVIRAAATADLDAINRIYNAEIATGVATWDEEPWSAEVRATWFTERQAASDAVLVAVRADRVIGFAYLSPYRSKRGYRFTREDTLYVEPAEHRRGVGRALLGASIDAARAARRHALVAMIEASNAASIALHARLGFAEVGRKREVGFKFGRWLDLVEMQLLL